MAVVVRRALWWWWLRCGVGKMGVKTILLFLFEFLRLQKCTEFLRKKLGKSPTISLQYLNECLEIMTK
jgi:hypothetical protein